ncbi:hypothetical protein GGR62_004269 [Xanthomonas campestris]|nr:hypothetical protein [Xanthomonas sp. 3075]
MSQVLGLPRFSSKASKFHFRFLRVRIKNYLEDVPFYDLTFLSLLNQAEAIC